jgi:Ca2+-binding RTX toxin-like protein
MASIPTNGNDILIGNLFNNTINALAGHDFVDGRQGNDTLDGGSGNDTLQGGLGNDSVVGGLGNDTIRWSDGDGSDFVSGGKNVDVLQVFGSQEKSDNFLLAQSSSGQLSLNQFALDGSLIDVITTDLSVEQFEFHLGGGDDLVTIQVGSPVQLITFFGGEGNDTFLGGSSATPFVGFGEAGDDQLIGSFIAANYLDGGDGNDILNGGEGNDTLIGGEGSDRFTYFATNLGVDQITDFNVKEDLIFAHHLAFGGGLQQGILLVEQFHLGSAATEEKHRFIYNSQTGGLFFDVDGSGNAQQIQLATLSAGLDMSHTNILIG